MMTRIAGWIIGIFFLTCLQPCPGGGWYVANTASGEWVQYQNVWLASGNYRFTAHVASAVSGSTFHLEIDGAAVQSGISVPNTGRADSFTNVHLGHTSVSQGYHTLKVVFETSGISLDWFMLSKDTDTSSTVKASDITMVRPSTSGTLIAPVVGYEHKTVTPGVGSSLCSVPGNDVNGHPYTDAQLSAWYSVPMYRDFDRRSDRYWDILVDDLLESRAQVPFFHCRSTSDFTHGLQDRDYSEGAGAYEGRWMMKLAEAVSRNPQAASALKVGMFWESGDIANLFQQKYGYYPAWGDPNFVPYVMQYWLSPWFDNMPPSMLYQPYPGRPIVSFFASTPTNIVADGRMGDFLGGVRAALMQKYGYNPLFILPVGGSVNPAAQLQGWGQAPWLTWGGPLLTTNPFGGTPWDSTSSGSRRRLDTVWLNDWNPATNTGTPNAGDANGVDSHQSRLNGSGNSNFFTTLAQAVSSGATLVQEEGFTNISEGNSIFRSYHPEWEYPNQHMAAMRTYADPTTQTEIFEAEGCDTYNKVGNTPNAGGSYRYEWYGEPNTLAVYRPLHNMQNWIQKSTGPGNLSQITAGFFDTWAMASNGTVWAEHIMGAPDTWAQVSIPTLTSVSVGKGYAWGLNGTTVYSASTPYGWGFNTTAGWTQRSGTMSQVSVGDSAVWGRDASGNIYKRPLDGSGAWTQITGNMDKIAAGDLFIWGIKGSTISYTSTTNINWVAVNNPNNINQIAVGSEEVWGVNASGSIYRRSISGIGDWDAVNGPGGTVTSLAVGDGYAWVLAGNTPYTRRLEGFLGSVTAPPIGLRAVATNTQVQLTWTTSTGATGYNIKRGTSSGGPYTTIASNVLPFTTVLSYTDSGLSSGTTYYYVVSALSSAGETTNSTETNAKPQSQTPSTPTAMCAGNGYGSVINLTWISGSANTAGFSIERSQGSSNSYTPIAAVPAPTSGYSDTTAVVGQQYTYRVRAYNAAGYSGYSNLPTVSAATPLSRSGWIASASSSNGGAASNTLDGNLSTRWSPGTSQTNGQWFQVDMGSPQSVYQIVLDATNNGGDYPRGYQVNVSTDGVNWGNPVATGAGSSAVTPISFSPVMARYIRVTQTTSGVSGGWWSIDEFNAYGTPVPTTLSRTGWIASASASNGGAASNALDSNLTTRWSPGTSQANGQWFQVDMTSNQTFSQITLAAPNSNNDYPVGYQVNVSTDGVNWGSPVATGASTQGVPSMTIAFPTQTARYIRITQTGTTGNWWSIDEFNVANSSSAWQNVDIGSVGIAGNAQISNSVYSVAGGGNDIWGTGDAFQYLSQPVTGNCSIVARVVTQQNTDPWAKAGVMIRDNTGAGAMNATMLVTPQAGINFQWRAGMGSSSSNAGTGGTAPYWVKVTRSGNSFTGFLSSDGVNWTQLGSTQTINMSPSANVGLAVTAHNNSLLCTATFDNVTITTP